MEFDTIDVSEGIDTNNASSSRECIIYHYWYLLKIKFKFQQKVCNGCHHMTRKSISFDDVAIVTFGENDYRIHFWFMSKSEAVDRIKNTYVTEKSGQQ